MTGKLMRLEVLYPSDPSYLDGRMMRMIILVCSPHGLSLATLRKERQVTQGDEWSVSVTE